MNTCKRCGLKKESAKKDNYFVCISCRDGMSQREIEKQNFIIEGWMGRVTATEASMARGPALGLYYHTLSSDLRGTFKELMRLLDEAETEAKA